MKSEPITLDEWAIILAALRTYSEVMRLSATWPEGAADAEKRISIADRAAALVERIRGQR